VNAVSSPVLRTLTGPSDRQQFASGVGLEAQNRLQQDRMVDLAGALLRAALRGIGLLDLKAEQFNPAVGRVEPVLAALLVQFNPAQQFVRDAIAFGRTDLLGKVIEVIGRPVVFRLRVGVDRDRAVLMADGDNAGLGIP
jgi:hypothetical protein